MLAVILAWQASVFAGQGAAGVRCIGVGAACALAAGIAAFVARAGKLAPGTAALIVAVLAIVAIAVSRYGFYMASVI